MIIKNIDVILNELTEMLMQFDRDLNTGYDTDIYLYYDEETQTARLEEFVNVGCNSWINDDHYTIYTDRQHYNKWYDDFDDEYTITDYLGIPVEQLMNEVKNYYGYDDDDIGYISFADIIEYVLHNEQYKKILRTAYEDDIDYCRDTYEEQAQEIMEIFFDDIAYLEHLQEYGY